MSKFGTCRFDLSTAATHVAQEGHGNSIGEIIAALVVYRSLQLRPEPCPELPMFGRRPSMRPSTRPPEWVPCSSQCCERVSWLNRHNVILSVQRSTAMNTDGAR